MTDGRQAGVIEGDSETYLVRRHGPGRRSYLGLAFVAGLAVVIVSAGLLGDRSPTPAQQLRAGQPASSTGAAPSASASIDSPIAVGSLDGPIEPPISGAPEPSDQAAPEPSIVPLTTLPGAIVHLPDPTQLRLAPLPADADTRSVSARGSQLFFVRDGQEGFRRILASLDVAGLDGARTVYTAPACHVIIGLDVSATGVVLSEAVGPSTAAAGCPGMRPTWRVLLLANGSASPRLVASGVQGDPAGPLAPLVAIDAGAYAYSIPGPVGPAHQTVEVHAIRGGGLLWKTSVPGEASRLMLAGSRLAATVLSSPPDVQAVGPAVAALGGPATASARLAAASRLVGGGLASTGEYRITELGWADASHRTFEVVAQPPCGQSLTADGQFLTWLDYGPAAIRVTDLDSGIQGTVFTGMALADPSSKFGLIMCDLATGSGRTGRFYAWQTLAGGRSFVTFSDGSSQTNALPISGQIAWLGVRGTLVEWVAVDPTGALTAGVLDEATFAAVPH